MSRFLILDGGTTNLRLTLTDEDGNILDREKRQAGAAASAIAGSNQALKEAVRDCIRTILNRQHLAPGEISRCIAYGMITSASGLLEIPHLCAPAGKEDFRRGMVSRLFPEIAPFPIEFIPGMKNFSGQVTTQNLARMDMMRGEETEAMGFYALMRPGAPCLLALPGSHTKFISMDEKGRLLGCMTTISGEMLSALTHHTILSESVGGQFASPEHYNKEMLLEGAAACAMGLGRAAFSARILKTLGGVPEEKTAYFLLGAVLQSDADALAAFIPDHSDTKIWIAGKEPLQTALKDLFLFRGYEAALLPAHITEKIGVAGALAIAGATHA